jgi:hypothetical protein
VLQWLGLAGPAFLQGAEPAERLEATERTVRPDIVSRQLCDVAGAASLLRPVRTIGMTLRTIWVRPAVVVALLA